MRRARPDRLEQEDLTSFFNVKMNTLEHRVRDAEGQVTSQKALPFSVWRHVLLRPGLHQELLAVVSEQKARWELLAVVSDEEGPAGTPRFHQREEPPALSRRQ